MVRIGILQSNKQRIQSRMTASTLTTFKPQEEGDGCRRVRLRIEFACTFSACNCVCVCVCAFHLFANYHWLLMPFLVGQVRARQCRRPTLGQCP